MAWPRAQILTITTWDSFNNPPPPFVGGLGWRCMSRGGGSRKRKTTPTNLLGVWMELSVNPGSGTLAWYCCVRLLKIGFPGNSVLFVVLILLSILQAWFLELPQQRTATDHLEDKRIVRHPPTVGIPAWGCK